MQRPLGSSHDHHPITLVATENHSHRFEPAGLRFGEVSKSYFLISLFHNSATAVGFYLGNY